MIQVGSFRSRSDAEGLRAQMTLLGLMREIQTVTVNEVTWHRVRVGPFDNAREADAARRRLLDNGHEAMVLSGG
jgi:cell division protein FtsN